jgi:signal transduction histidine kinase
VSAADDVRRTRRLQLGFLVLLIIATAELGWWLVDQVRYTGEVRAQQQADYEADTGAARAMLRAGQSWAQVHALFPALTASGDRRTIAVSPGVIGTLDRQHFHRLDRYAWEGAFFFAVLLGAMGVVYRALREEAELRRRQEQFLAGMSHELKSPLASLRLSVETLALRDPPSAQRAELVRRMLVELGRLQGMIGNVLDTSRLASAGGRHTPEQLALAEEVACAAEDLADFATEGDVSIDAAIPPELTVVADRDATLLVLRNLLHNAIKASPPGRAVRVRAEATNGHVTLVVRDEGAGFPPDEAPHLFEKFYRVDREERSRMQGTGLGLYLVRRHVELDHGTVSATSPGPDQGATFTVIWPADKRGAR